MSKQPYNMAFTTGGLYLREAVVVAGLFNRLKDWDAVERQLTEENLFQSRTVGSLKRNRQELLHRLKLLNEAELSFLEDADPADQRALLWLAVCRRYRFIREFASQVLREKYLSFQGQISYDDFDWFFNRRAEWDEKLEKITPASREKLRQVLFRIMREAELINRSNQINPALFGRGFIDLVASTDRREFACFPILEKDIEG